MSREAVGPYKTTLRVIPNFCRAKGPQQKLGFRTLGLLGFVFKVGVIMSTLAIGLLLPYPYGK
jgi:hypothetical protein